MANQMMCKGCEDSEEPEYGIYLISDLQNIGVLPFAIGRNCLPGVARLHDGDLRDARRRGGHARALRIRRGAARRAPNTRRGSGAPTGRECPSGRLGRS